MGGCEMMKPMKRNRHFEVALNHAFDDWNYCNERYVCWYQDKGGIKHTYYYNFEQDYSQWNVVIWLAKRILKYDDLKTIMPIMADNISYLRTPQHMLHALYNYIQKQESENTNMT